MSAADASEASICGKGIITMTRFVCIHQICSCKHTSRKHNLTYKFNLINATALIEDSAFVEDSPGFESHDVLALPLGFFHTNQASTGLVSRKQTWSVINIS